MENADLSDKALVSAIREVLASAQSVSLAQKLLRPHVHICFSVCVFF